MEHLQSLLAVKNHTVIVIQLPHKIKTALLQISMCVFALSLSGCLGVEIKPEHGLQKSPCACLGIIYDSRVMG